MVGGGDSAASEALYLASIAKTVHLVVRKEKLKAEKIWQKKVAETPNIIIHYNSASKESRGKFEVEEVLLESGEAIALSGVFVAIGSDPDASLFAPYGVALDHDGCIKVDSAQRTSIPGLYAAGDVTTNSNKFKQALISAAE